MYAKLEQVLSSNNVSCSRESIEKICRYYELMINWNQHTNLTALTSPDDFIYKHIYDSLYPGRFFDPHDASLVDVGTGAGFPGLPLKIIYPDLKLSLVEASTKRVEFLRHCCSSLEIEAEIFPERAEDFGRDIGREVYNVAATRAVAKLAVICEYCLPLLRIGGVFLALKGPGGAEELEEARTALNILGGSVGAVHHYNLPTGDERSLVVIEKIAPTPEKYPRRPGVAAKKPL